MKWREPDIYVMLEIRDIRILDFSKVEEKVFRQAAPEVEALRNRLTSLVEIVESGNFMPIE